MRKLEVNRGWFLSAIILSLFMILSYSKVTAFNADSYIVRDLIFGDELGYAFVISEPRFQFVLPPMPFAIFLGIFALTVICWVHSFNLHLDNFDKFFLLVILGNCYLLLIQILIGFYLAIVTQGIPLAITLILLKKYGERMKK